MQWIKIHVNLDNYFESSQGHPKIMIMDFPSTITHLKKSITPLVIAQLSSVKGQMCFPQSWRF